MTRNNTFETGSLRTTIKQKYNMFILRKKEKYFAKQK